MEPRNSTPNSTQPPVAKPLNKMLIIIAGGLAVLLFGLGIGWVVSSRRNSIKKATLGSAVIVGQTEAGSTDTSAFKDTTTGTLQKGGIQGEGAFHLDRPGGPTQTVYLNSTVVDMNPFIGKKVQVWGQTVAAHHAPWLMDVGHIKVIQ